MIGRGASCRPAMPRNCTTVRPAGRERRTRATLSHAEPRKPRRRLPGAVRAHDEGGAVTINAGGLTINAGELTMTAAERDRTPNHATLSRTPSPEPPRRPHRSVRAHEAGGASHYGRGAVTMTAAPSL